MKTFHCGRYLPMPRILVIDDEETVREMICTMLRHAGYEVHEAPDGTQGVALYKRDPVDLVIVDIEMPGKGGLEVIREIREECPEAPFIAITGYNPQRLDDALELGAAHTFRKPFAMAAFLQALESLLGKQS
jgi:CheY-like chemotaxis protein